MPSSKQRGARSHGWSIRIGTLITPGGNVYFGTEGVTIIAQENVNGMIQALDQILAQTDGQTKIVPGHGPVATRSDLQNYRDILVVVRQRISALIGAGRTMNETVVGGPTKDFDALWGSGYVSPDVFVRMVFASLTDSGKVNP
jgi:cyclase